MNISMLGPVNVGMLGLPFLLLYLAVPAVVLWLTFQFLLVFRDIARALSEISCNYRISVERDRPPRV